MVLTSNSVRTNYVVKDISYVGSARREIKNLVKNSNVTEEILEKVSLVVTEMATNLAKHTDSGGEIIANILNENTLQLISIDQGPGIESTDSAMIDGMSTSGTFGVGFGGLRRQSKDLFVYSKPGEGTIVVCEIGLSQKEISDQKDKNFDIGIISTPHPKEEVNGDGVAFYRNKNSLKIMVIDGLGHGQGAHEASSKAVEKFEENKDLPIDELLNLIHTSLNSTRGAAIALANIDKDKTVLDFIGVGNITARLQLGMKSEGCVSRQGIIGKSMGNPRIYSHDWKPESSLLMYSDGIKSNAKLEPRDFRPAIVLASEIYRDFKRGTDDTTNVVIRDLRV